MEYPFNQPFESIRSQILSFLEHVEDTPPSREVLKTAIHRISTLLEELQTLEEELGAQNDEILQAQLAVNQQRRQNTELIELASDGYLLTDLHGVIREANQAAASLLKTRPESLIGKPLVLNLAPADHANFFAWLGEIAQASGAQERALRLQPWGEHSPFEVKLRVAAFHDDPGQIAGLRWLIRDVSHPKTGPQEPNNRSVQNQREAGLLQSIFDADPGGLAVLVGTDLRFAYANPAYCASIPDPSTEITGKPYEQVWSGNQMSQLRDDLRNVLKTGQPYIAGDLEYQSADGSLRSSTLQARSIEWEEKPAVLLILWDITDLKQGKAALNKSQHQLNDLLESIQDGFMQLNRGWCFTYVNAQAAGYLGTEPHGLVGKNLWEAFPEILGTEAERMYRQVMENRQPDSLETVGVHSGKVYEIRVYPSEEGISIFWVDITSRKQAEEEVLESRRRVQETLESIPNQFFEVDSRWQVTFVNQQVVSSLGIQPEEAIGKNLWELYPGIIGTPQETILRTAMETRQPVHAEILAERTNRWYEYHIYPSPAGITVYYNDITERKLSEEALRESQERFRSVLENSLDIAYRRDLRRDCYDYLSPVVEQVLGYTVEEMNEMPIKVLMEHVHPDDRAGMGVELDQAFAAGSGHLVYRFQTKTGEYRWLADNVTITRSDRGIPVYRTGILRDITETKATEAQLNLTVERLQAIIASPLIGVVIGDASGMLYQANDYYLDLIGYTREEFEQGAVKWNAITPPEHLPLDNQALQELRELGVCKPYEKQYIRKDGSRVWVLINDAMLPGEEDLIVGFVLNIEERKQVEEQNRDREVHLELQRRLLLEREEERLGIARDLHDGPLQDLIAAQFVVQGMQDEEDPQRLKEQAADLRKMLSGLIRDLRNFAVDLRPPVLTAFGLERGIRSHLDLFENRHPEIRVHFSAHQIGQLTPSDVRIAMFRIYQECLNNIVKHTHATEVWITFTKDEEWAVMEIRDNGEGFVVPHDWLDVARHGHLGLVGMRERAMAVGGNVEITSLPGQGTTLRITARLHE